MTPHARKIGVTAAVLTAIGAACALGVLHHRAALPKRFAPVVEGRLYRSAEVSPVQLETLVHEHGIRTVLSLLDPQDPGSVAEREAADRLGIAWKNVRLTGDGASTPQQRDEIKQVLFDASAAPLLVHCAAGANRTGLAIGMYRLHAEGWSLDAVLDEMRQFGFKDKPQHANLRDALADEAKLAGDERRAAGGVRSR